MGSPMINEFGKLAEKYMANEAARDCPLGSTPMVSKEFNEVYCLMKPNQNASFKAPTELILTDNFESKVSKPEPQQVNESKAPKIEQRGRFEVGVDEKGQLVRVKTSDNGYLTKNDDGSWDEWVNGKVIKKLDDVKVDKDGNLDVDFKDDNGNKAHARMNADGSSSRTTVDGTYVRDADGNLTEAPRGDGQSRKFHYTNGELDQIDGSLGHWEKTTQNGQTAWVNKDSGAVWQGEMSVNDQGTLQYRGPNGVAWGFTAQGQDVQPTSKAS